mmetsp:Transcript_14912/g.37533  ORF Transcript_14912/g.37533 Transcript_14912/m.37533 type:complete len:329 (+) Transcript_14912:471-1457(+)
MGPNERRGVVLLLRLLLLLLLLRLGHRWRLHAAAYGGVCVDATSAAASDSDVRRHPLLGLDLRVLVELLCGVEAGPDRDLIPVLLKQLVHPWPLRGEFFQQRRERGERRVLWVLVPRQNEDAVVRLQHEVFLHIVDDQGLLQIATNPAQVLHEDRAPRQRVLAVQAVLDEPAGVDAVDDPVRVILGGRGEDHNLEPQLVHPLEEILHPRPDLVAAQSVVLGVMYQGLVEVQHQGVGVGVVRWRKLRHMLEVRQHRGQGLEPHHLAVGRHRLRPVPHIGVLGRPVTIVVQPVRAQEGRKAHRLQQLRPHDTRPLLLQGHPRVQDVVHGG